MGMLCAACLRDGCQPPRAVSSSRWRGAARRLEPLEATASPPRWRRAARTLPERSQDAISPLLLTSLLRSSKDIGDLRHIQRLITTAAAAGLLCCPVVREAAGLLRRTALGQRAISRHADLDSRQTRLTASTGS